MKKRLMAAVLTLVLTAALSASALAGETAVGVLDEAPRPMQQENPWLEQCELGSAAADALRVSGGTQLALLETGALANDLNQGQITREMVDRVFTDPDRQLAQAEITPALLRQMLECSVSHIQVNPATEQVEEDSLAFDGFCQISGFQFRYDASAPAGERVTDLWLEDGTRLDLADRQTRLTLTATVELLEGAYGFPAVEYVPLELSLSDALADYVAQNTALPQGETDRIQVIGARQNTLVGDIPRVWLGLGIAALVLVLAVFRLRGKRWQQEWGKEF